MRESSECCRGAVRRGGFTLIELLASVAVISLLMAMLLPSLNKARKQARTTLDAVRIATLTRAMCLYCEENNDTPPFIGRGWEDIDDKDDEEWPAGSGITVGQLKRWETWCVNRPEAIWFLPQEEWPADVGVEFGSLFPYARFKEVYRCPEFERIPDGLKAQGAFNYTRTILGRKWYVHGRDPEAERFANRFGAPGPIMKTSEIHSPAKMWMLMDEWYLRHCASPDNEFRLRPMTWVSGGWMANDCLNFYLGDELGQYHGAPVKGLSATGTPVAVRKGSVSHYDGHVELYRDLLPGRTTHFRVNLEAMQQLVDFLIDHLFAQRGIAVADLI